MNLRRPMLLNDRSLTNQNYGLGNSSNLTNQDSYVHLVDTKIEENNSVLAGHSQHLSSQYFRDRFDPFPPFLRPATRASYACNRTLLQFCFIESLFLSVQA